MNRKIKAILGIGISIVVVIAMIVYVIANMDYSITITNQLENSTVPMRIETKEGVLLGTVDKIDSKKIWKNVIDTSEIEKETSIVLVHTDAEGLKFTEILDENVVKGSTGKVKVNITGIDEDGKISIEIK